jgi:hypothetical protein
MDEVMLVEAKPSHAFCAAKRKRADKKTVAACERVRSPQTNNVSRGGTNGQQLRAGSTAGSRQENRICGRCESMHGSLLVQ